MKARVVIIIAGSLILILLSPFLLRKRTVTLVSNSRVVAVARRPLLPAWIDGKVDVYVGREKVFSLWEDAFDGPMFIYPFADGRRFLCDYDFDTAILDFVVDLRVPNPNKSRSFTWPSDAVLRDFLARMPTNVVLGTNGFVRLPTLEELREVSGYVATSSPAQITGLSFPLCDLGVYRRYASKEYILLDLATNRDSHWPLPK